MSYLSLPLSIDKGGIRREDDLKRSIDMNLAMLISTPKHSCPADLDYGFVFNNFRFNIFNENEGVIFDSNPQLTFDYENGMYSRKISGKSQNINTFASELSIVINKYEPRLNNVKISMTYQRDEKIVYINVKGNIISTGEEYTFSTTIKAWN